MGFKVHHDEEKPLMFTVNSALHARFKKALAFANVSQKALLTQMIEHCLDDLEEEMQAAQQTEETKQAESQDDLEPGKELHLNPDEETYERDELL